MERFFSEHPVGIAGAVAAGLLAMLLSDSSLLVLLAIGLGYFVGSQVDAQRK
jgi:hypothetical protein